MIRSCLRGATLNQLGGPIIAMVQPSKAWVRHDRTKSCGGSSAGRCLPRKAKMRAVFMVVADVFREQPFQMVFIERDDMIQQVVAAASNPALGDPILPLFAPKDLELPSALEMWPAELPHGSACQAYEAMSTFLFCVTI